MVVVVVVVPVVVVPVVVVVVVLCLVPADCLFVPFPHFIPRQVLIKVRRVRLAK